MGMAMANPATMAMLGAAAGAVLDRKQPLRGAALGGMGGYFLGPMMASPAATGAQANAAGLAQMGQGAGLSGPALDAFVKSGGTLGSTAAGGGGAGAAKMAGLMGGGGMQNMMLAGAGMNMMNQPPGQNLQAGGGGMRPTDAGPSQIGQASPYQAKLPRAIELNPASAYMRGYRGSKEEEILRMLRGGSYG